MKNSKLLLAGIVLLTSQLAVAAPTPDLNIYCCSDPTNGKIVNGDTGQLKKDQKCVCEKDTSKKPKQLLPKGTLKRG